MSIQERYEEVQGDNTREACRLCPRACGVQRASGQTGYCGMPETVYVSRIAPHMWEEPPISGTRGSGAVFFTGCHLRCVYCQNRMISHERQGWPLTEEELTLRLQRLAESGVHNLNLVTPTHYTRTLVRILEKIKPTLPIPVVWNSSGYETPEALAMLDGLVDVYLPDFKYISSDVAAALSMAPTYPLVATEAIQTMYAQVGPVTFDADGLMTRGLLVRHLVLPGYRKESIAVMEHLAALLPLEKVRISVMSQYTPEFAMSAPQKSLHRRLTDFEYQSVLEACDRLGIQGYRQGRASATSSYTPDFTEKTVTPDFTMGKV